MALINNAICKYGYQLNSGRTSNNSSVLTECKPNS